VLLLISKVQKTILTAFSLAVFFCTAASSGSGSTRDIVKGRLGNQIDGYMQRLEQSGFSGSLLVAKEGEIVFAKGLGLADRAKEIRATSETIFDIGSITKQFTGAAILKLEMMGKLKVPDRITKYFHDVPADKRDITLHHLLTHSAGFRGGLGFDYAEIGRDAYISLAMETDLNRPPGVEYEYSNVGFSLLAAIVEQVSGQSYDAFTREHLFEPAGMLKTGYLLPNWEKEVLARGYRGDKDWGTPLDHKWDDDGPYWHLRGNGGILSNVHNMYKWHLALEGTKILSEAAKEKYYSPHIPEGHGARSFYGYGWSVMETPRKTTLITHNGGNPYSGADFLRYVDDDVVIIMMSNTNESRAFDHSRQIARIAFGMKEESPAQAGGEQGDWGLPDSPTGRRSSAVLDAIHRGENAFTLEFAKNNLSSIYTNREGLVKQVRQAHQLLGDFGVIGAEKTGPSSARIKVQSKGSGKILTITLELESQAPYKIIALGFEEGS
jgi:CubicO group peptidase (beta-lactamase class C family)